MRTYALAALLGLCGCPAQPPATQGGQSLDAAIPLLQPHLGGQRQSASSVPRELTTVTGTLVPTAQVTPTSVSVGVTTQSAEQSPPYALTPTITFDGANLQISATTDLPDDTLYRLGVQREITVTPDPSSTVTQMMTHAGGFMPKDPVTLPEDGLPTSFEGFVPTAGRITGGALVATVEMFPRHVQLFGSDDDPKRYRPNAKEVTVTFAVERDLPGQVKGLSWSEGTERFVWRHTVPCPLPDKATP